MITNCHPVLPDDMDTMFAPPLLVTVPHFDDEILGCGGMLAMHPRKEHIHILFITAGDSMPIKTAHAQNISDIGTIRKKESIAALKHLGIPEKRCHFVDIPEGQVSRNQPTIAEKLNSLIREIAPQTILTPFRFDQHPDHITLNRIVHQCADQQRIIEYFVYYNYPLLPKKDIRRYCRTENLYQLDISSVSRKKADALNLFISQTSVFYPNQCRPVLSPELINDYSTHPEYYMQISDEFPRLTIPACIVTAAQILQPRLKRIKETLRYLITQKT